MRTLILMILVLAVGCDQPTPEPEQSEVPPAQPTPTREPTPEPRVEPSLPEADVQAVVQTWLAAQNEGDFDRYSGVYADKFEGIKRVGARVYRFGHDDWLKDRQRMFKKKMKVAASEVKVQTNPSTAIVVFEQTWASGSYKDVGPKQLIIVKQKDGLRIAREEMLESHIASGDGIKKRAYDPQGFMLLADGAVVLDLTPKRSWEKGPAKIASRPTSATKELDVELSGYGAWIGRELELFTADGTACGARIKELGLVARIVPHFGTVNIWEGVWEGEGMERASDAEVAGDIWRMAADSFLGEGVLLVGRLDNRCDGAIWARTKGGQAKPLPARPLQGPDERNVLAALTDLPGYHAIQADYASSGHGGAWHESSDANVSFTAFGEWIAASVRAGVGCGGFEGGFWGFWQRSAQRSLMLRTNDENPGLWYFAPKAAVQLGDTVYFLDGERVVSQVQDSWELLWEVLPLNFDCSC